MTLKTLAGAAMCSEGLLSKFENGKNCPSLPMLGRIAQALDIPLVALLDGQPSREPVIHRGRPPSDRLGLDVSVDLQRLALDVGHSTPRCGILRIAPGRASTMDAHEPGDEAGIVLEGRPSLIVDGRSHALGVGDAFAFRAEQLHAYENAGPMPARIFRVYTPSAAA